MVRIGPLLLAAALLLALATPGCGDDNRDETVTAQTETATPSGTTAAQPLHDCPDADVSGVAVTEIHSNVDCAEAAGLASEVLTRDDCVEETPGGANTCRAGDFDCETTIAGATGNAIFDVSCEAGERHVEFQQQTPSAAGAGPRM